MTLDFYYGLIVGLILPLFLVALVSRRTSAQCGRQLQKQDSVYRLRARGFDRAARYLDIVG